MKFWKSNYKLPLSFIIFFVLMFFLIGEQLPALPTYLLGPGSGEGGPGKLHILDLVLGDGLLHRPFAYLIIGTVIWILYRIFTWPLAWFMGAVLWILEQQTLTPLDQRPTLINAIAFTATFWILLTLVPYFVYKWVDKKWERRGKRNAILIVLAINLLLFSFFAYQIYYLHNSYHSAGSRPGLPTNTCPKRLVIEKDKQTTAFWDGKILPVSGEVQNWVEKNCPEAIRRVEQQNNRQQIEQKAVDFTPPTGKTNGPGANGPWAMRLMSARSTDGLNFQRTNQVITDQGDVPDLVVDEKGRIYLYYVGWTVADEQNKTAVAISEDNGKTWIYKKAGLRGFEGGMAAAVDPDIQLLEDGIFRLYLTSDPEDGLGPRTYYAEGADGINFIKMGVAFFQSGKHILDPSTLRTPFGWHLFAGGNGPGKGWHAISEDGKTFTSKEYKEFVKDGKGHIFANAITIPGGYRAYAFDNKTIVSFFSKDGENWTAEDGVRLTLNNTSGYETGVLKDPTVVQLPDDSYLMVYVTKIP